MSLVAGNVGYTHKAPPVLRVLSVLSDTVSCYAWSKLDSNCTKVITSYVLAMQHMNNQTWPTTNII